MHFSSYLPSCSKIMTLIIFSISLWPNTDNYFIFTVLLFLRLNLLKHVIMRFE